jgi:large subunit ribosomal protein L25
MAKRHKLTIALREHKAGPVRRAGGIPAVMYGNQEASRSVQVDAKAFGKTWRAAGTTSLINLELEQASYPALIRDVARHPLTGAIIHVDFYLVRLDQPIEANIPLVFTGVAPAVKEQGGVLVRNMAAVEVKALPQDLPHEITLDISALATFDTTLHVNDLIVPQGVTVLNAPEEVIALVQAPRTEEELAGLSAEVKEDVESVEGVKKEEKEPAEGAAEGSESAPAA